MSRRSEYQSCECEIWPDCGCDNDAEWMVIFNKMLDDWEADMKAMGEFDGS